MSSTSDIRKSFIDYFASKNHKVCDSSNLIPHNDDTLLFTNAGMVQFKNYFTGIETPEFSNAVSVQKCLRAGGKHNDLDNVGYTARHHTFFEMLGNFSFGGTPNNVNGGYFKEQAISYAWEYLTKVVGLNKDKLIVTVYHTDDEAYNLWKSIAGLPDSKIIKISTKDNFWEMGDTGPCGPCSEIFYDHGEHIKGGLPGTPEEDGDRFIEIWNIVFMQYEKLPSGELLPLKKPCIDTGMGLERFASILQGKQDNYDIDLFQSIISASESEIGVKVTQENKAAFKVIADHIRSSSFMISEGILPSNEGRGYVLRRILRRAVRYAYMLGSSDPVLYKIFPALKNQMAHSYKELAIHDLFITDTIKQEEIKFHETFSNGIKILNEEIEKVGKGQDFSGKTAFRLYDTYGFPVDLTKDVLRGRNIQLNSKEFDEAFQHHRDLAKKSWQGSGEAKDDKIWFALSEKLEATKFTGHDTLIEEAQVLSIISLNKNKVLDEVEELKANQEGYVITNKTPFYAEMGGQVGDKGFITNGKGLLVKVLDTQKRSSDLFAHKILVVEGILKKETVSMSVDKELRDQISRHHTVAHLLHASLFHHLGNHITQQGSMINEQRMRFDISHSKALTSEEIEKIEASINKAILANYPVTIESMELSKAIHNGAKALFGEKYPKIARTVKIGEMENENYSFELCGGTHVKSTGECGIFKIISESSIASGVRRIEAVAGFRALEYVQGLNEKIKNIGNSLGVDVKMIEEKIISTLEDNKKLKKNLESLNSKYYIGILKDKFSDINGTNTLVANIEAEPKELRNIANNLLSGLDNTFVYVSTNVGEKSSFIMAISKDISTKIDLKAISADVFSLVGGTGGGSNLIIQGQGSIHKVEDTKDLLHKVLVK